jgi:PAS domain S-box-containing protein
MVGPWPHRPFYLPRARRQKAVKKRSIVANKQDAVARLDVYGNVLNSSADAERLLGYTAQEAIGQHFSLFHSDEDIRGNLPSTILRTSENIRKSEAEGWQARKDDTRFWAQVVIDPICDPSGALAGFAAAISEAMKGKWGKRRTTFMVQSPKYDLRQFRPCVQRL